MFTLKSIHIHPECKYIKNLHPGDYDMEEYPLADFYGKNVSLHIIVGKNGSGKSSLLDLVSRMVNNVGAILCKDVPRSKYSQLRYVRNLYADLYYEFSEKELVFSCKLSIRDKALWLKCNDDVYWLSDQFLIPDKDSNIEYKDIRERSDDGHFHDLSGSISENEKIELANMFFYTIVSNYSILSFQISEYNDEDALEYDTEVLSMDCKGNFDVDDSGVPRPKTEWLNGRNWIEAVFKMNDDYKRPIIFNPNRESGIIDMEKENSITIDGLSALLVHEFKDNIPILDDYCIDKIKYNIDKDFYKRFPPINSQPKEYGYVMNELCWGRDLRIFKEVALKENTTSWEILRILNYPSNPNMSDIEFLARLCVVYEVLNIAASYPHYSQYLYIGKIEKTFSNSDEDKKDELENLISEISNRYTFAELKFHQANNFIHLIENAKRKDKSFNAQCFSVGFDFDAYCEKLEITIPDSIDQCMRILPPEMFKSTIYLKTEEIEGIPFSRMSSGQRQMLYQMTMIMYHLLLLKSNLKADGIRYRNVNVVLDEIEVCYHPEYQRLFISQMLSLIVERLHLNEDLNIHFWMTTHSPFILSDVPDCLITYMEGGKKLSKEELSEREIRTPMAGNISELLHQSFFLNNGFIGEFVRNKILDLLKFFKNEKTSYEWNMEKAKTFIDDISDEFIKKQLYTLYRQKHETHIH